jgi:DNA/RNA endonuclease G (NUC1)
MPPTAASSQPRPNVLMPKYALSVDELEKLLNFDLFSALDDNIENTVEASTSELFR